jgi:DNA-binding transcriptional ArsR family regulator
VQPEHNGDEESLKDLVRLLAALSEVNRYRIVTLLAAETELSCGAVGSALGLSPSLISHHLAVLEGAGVIDRRKNGLWTMNRLRRDTLTRRLAGLQRIMAGPEPAAVRTG